MYLSAYGLLKNSLKRGKEFIPVAVYLMAKTERHF
jgi:hypothetical protein